MTILDESYRREFGAPRPACGERRRPPSAAVLSAKNAEAKLRLCRIARCDPGEGVQVSPLAPIVRLPLTPTLSRKNGEREHTSGIARSTRSLHPLTDRRPLA